MARVARRRRWAAVAVSTALLVVAACTGSPPGSPEPVPPGGVPSNPGGATDPAAVALSVLPPGNGNASGHTAASIDDQRVIYDAVEDQVADGTLTDVNLADFFVDNH